MGKRAAPAPAAAPRSAQVIPLPRQHRSERARARLAELDQLLAERKILGLLIFTQYVEEEDRTPHLDLFETFIDEPERAVYAAGRINHLVNRHLDAQEGRP